MDVCAYTIFRRTHFHSPEKDEYFPSSFKWRQKLLSVLCNTLFLCFEKQDIRIVVRYCRNVGL